ncbi:hypothetical protein HanXRQr2_Chr09g0398201 [Helianthus annuus]|uniref:Uncharacterized protein n=1 Tax=Helianthus annuus TaxID=4232 RepID=A0A9K3I783_HELAN|nr:hypothetical protein HanXRQr2_Chr09g0398201 [Helianthus annuus]KAJ0526756.1 hypothetical protein HanHA300_Chr09g0326691 [Helianthus annuus]KAJ0543151.1 hypothetical protein HanHA89_Chr09g0347611 [Helianthus annuus]KAJ0629278.1 hypothetical protein HanIR_Chr00c17g0909401 [Helianthus annuus]KAJ0708202.1 hypothetical protein HanLR1_Chr09g0326911 [Helianthus annuus]
MSRFRFSFEFCFESESTRSTPEPTRVNSVSRLIQCWSHKFRSKLVKVGQTVNMVNAVKPSQLLGQRVKNEVRCNNGANINFIVLYLINILITEPNSITCK